MQIRISFRSRSDLVLDVANALDFLSYLVLQACISFYSVSDKSGTSMFLPCSHKNAVAHMFLQHWEAHADNGVMQQHASWKVLRKFFKEIVS